MPYVNQHIQGSRWRTCLFTLVTPMISPCAVSGGIHPGYREERKVHGPATDPAGWMLLAARDAVASMRRRTDEGAATVFAQQVPFARGRREG